MYRTRSPPTRTTVSPSTARSTTRQPASARAGAGAVEGRGPQATTTIASGMAQNRHNPMGSLAVFGIPGNGIALEIHEVAGPARPQGGGGRGVRDEEDGEGAGRPAGADGQAHAIHRDGPFGSEESPHGRLRGDRHGETA